MWQRKVSNLSTKIAIMLLHIHNFFFLLRAYHSMQSTLPCHRGSRGGGITATVGGENSEKSPCESRCFFLILEVQPFRYPRVNHKKFPMLKCTSHAAKLKGRGHRKNSGKKRSSSTSDGTFRFIRLIVPLHACGFDR